MNEHDELFYLHQKLKDAILRGIATSDRARVLENELAMELAALDEPEPDGRSELPSESEREYFELRLSRHRAEIDALCGGEGE